MNKLFRPTHFIICLIFIAIIITIGANLLPLEPDPPDFKFRYVDIYNKFFKKQIKQGQIVYVTQRDRTRPGEFAAIKTNNTIRIFIVGGSAGYNFGYFDFANYLKLIAPDKDFQVINCGVGAYDSYREALVIKEILLYKPDLIILFSGNNEFGLKPKINLFVYYINKYLRRFKYYRYLQESILNRYYDKTKTSCYRNHEEIIKDFTLNIQRMAMLIKSRNIPFIICTLPVNFRDCAPGGRRPADRQYLKSVFLLEKGEYKAAINAFERYLGDNRMDAFGLYFLASAYESSGDYLKAKELYLQSVEADFGRGRTMPSLNAAIRQVGADNKIGFVDLENVFMSTSEHGLLGKDQFYDHCHWHFAYNQLVAEYIVRAMLQKPQVFAKIVLYSACSKPRAPFSPPQLTNIIKSEGRIDERIENVAAEIYILNASLSSTSFISERAISFLKMLYEIDPEIVWNIQYHREQIENGLLNSIWTKANTVKFGINMKWPCLLTHIGEMYRRFGIYDKAFFYTNKAISLNRIDHLPYLVDAFTYNRMGDFMQALQSLNHAEAICVNDPEVVSLKNILSAERSPR